MDFIVILLLIIFNGILAMTEIAVVSSRKTRLKQLAEKGDVKAKSALDLASNPNRFLSAIQIGITFIGIFAGAFGGGTLARTVSGFLSGLPLIGQFSEIISLFLVVSLITYLSLVIGELVPKRIALINPESTASFMAPFLQAFSVFVAPLINLLSRSTDWVLAIFGVKEIPRMPITEEEVKSLITEGARIGVFNLAERDIVERTFRLSDKKANMLMTPRKEIKWLDINMGGKTIKRNISGSSYSYYPVCNKELDKVVGVVRTKELLTHYFVEEKLDLKKMMHKPIFIPETMNALKVLELFKKTGIHMALAVDEYGNIVGLLSITDILEAIIGDIPTIDEYEEREIIRRDDGTWLIDGMVLIDEFKEYFRIKKLPRDESGAFSSVGGFVMAMTGHIPRPGNSFDAAGFRFEVMDMDGNRVDKILLKKIN